MFKKTALIVIFVVFVISAGHCSTSTWLMKKKLSIVIDDMGYDKNLAYKFLSLNMPLAYSFLPDATYSTQLSNRFGERGYTVMIHMPSEPIDYPKDNPGKNAIYTTTSREKTFYLLNRAYENVHYAMGLNNHMGSKILQDKRHLDYIMEFLKTKHLFFIDSATIADSLGCKEAKKFDILCARRRVFLDNIKNVNYIKGQIELAVKMLKKRNSVVAIGHCSEATYEALREEKKLLKPYIIDVEYIVQ